jgi:hypothetical protein
MNGPLTHLVPGVLRRQATAEPATPVVRLMSLFKDRCWCFLPRMISIFITKSVVLSVRVSGRIG